MFQMVGGWDIVNDVLPYIVARFDSIDHCCCMGLQQPGKVGIDLSAAANCDLLGFFDTLDGGLRYQEGGQRFLLPSASLSPMWSTDDPGCTRPGGMVKGSGEALLWCPSFRVCVRILKRGQHHLLINCGLLQSEKKRGHQEEDSAASTSSASNILSAALSPSPTQPCSRAFSTLQGAQQVYDKPQQTCFIIVVFTESETETAGRRKSQDSSLWSCSPQEVRFGGRRRGCFPGNTCYCRYVLIASAFCSIFHGAPEELLRVRP
ncbi:hypothetical protein GE09DRAFT_596553 [Coniochaeta sp. 2T2.1]|nr:hypothetical protein GE09DRAFT_596553 [Coniochaeta sp. 2T2.1]